MSNWFTIKNAKESAEILIYDQIGKDWLGNDGVNAKAFAEALKDIPAKTPITVAINSPGGNVWDGLAIAQQLAQRKEYVTTRVDGVAASIASIIALAGSKLVMPENSLFMIHDPSGMAAGTAEDMRKMADTLEQHADLLAGIYAKKTGKSKDQIRQLMAAETWFTGAEAKDFGFADEVTGQVQLAAQFNFHQSLRHVPAALVALKTPPPQSASGTPTKHMETQPTATASGPVAAAGANPVQFVDHSKELDAIKAQLKAERDARITNEYRLLAQHRPYMAESEWLPKVLNDESIMDAIRKMPVQPEAEPVQTLGTVSNLGNPAIEAYRALGPSCVFNAKGEIPSITAETARKRIAHRKLHGAGIEAQMQRFGIRNSNTVSSTLKPDVLADAVITVANNRLAALNAFSRLFSADTVRPGASVQVKKATSGSTGQTNPTNFESGDSVLDPISVTMAHKTQSFQVSPSDRNYGFMLEDIAQVNAQSFANLLSDVYTALFTTGNYGTATSIGVAATFAADSLKPVLALAKNYRAKNLLLDGGHLAYLLPTDREAFRLGEAGAFGFDLMVEQNRWTSAATNAAGFVCSPDAVAIATALPVNPSSSQFEQVGSFTVAELGLSVLYTNWFNTATRVHWASYEIMFGAGVGDSTQAEVLVTS